MTKAIRTKQQTKSTRLWRTREIDGKELPMKMDGSFRIGVQLNWPATMGLMKHMRKHNLTASAALRDLCTAAARVHVATGGRRPMPRGFEFSPEKAGPLAQKPGTGEDGYTAPRRTGKALGAPGWYTVTGYCYFNACLDRAAWNGLNAYMKRNNRTLSAAVRELCTGAGSVGVAVATRRDGDWD